MRDIIVRGATPQDAAAIVDLVDTVAARDETLGIDRFPFSTEREAEFLGVADCSVYLSLVAVSENGIVVGLLTASRGTDSKLRHLSSLAIAVADGHRQQGVGAALLEGFLAWAIASGVRKATLSVLVTNAPAIRLFLRHGFLPEATRRGQLRIQDRYVDELLMARWLPDEEESAGAPQSKTSPA